MQRNPSHLQRREFDLLVIGGGIAGACVAHDATLRGLSVALVEQRDYGSATSAASSRILHSGIRYLQELRVGKVRESARERAAFVRVAPHLTRYIPFLIPSYRGSSKGEWLLRAGTAVHSVLTREFDTLVSDSSHAHAPPQFISVEECVARVPSIDRAGLTGGCVFHECQMVSSERMTLAFILSADERGAVVTNYMRALRLISEGPRVTGAVVQDDLTGAQLNIKARVVVQAMGPWRGLSVAAQARAVGPKATWNAKGAHIVTRPLTSGCAVALRSARPIRRRVGYGRRFLFVQPWHGHSLIGTTNDRFDGTPDGVHATGEDIASLTSDVNAALPGANLCESDVRHAYAGLFPITVDPSTPHVYQTTGDQETVDHAHAEGIDGLISVLSMKFTTARVLAERTTDLVMRKLGKKPVECSTTTVPLFGGDVSNLDALAAEYRGMYSELDDRAVRHLIAQHGSRVPFIMSSLRPLVSKRLHAARVISEADVYQAAVSESAVHLEDVVFRRTALGDLGPPPMESLYRSASIMASRLGWSAAETEAEVQRTLQVFPVQTPESRR
jgi:glycerol-3-phosphate dehydrogenase